MADYDKQRISTKPLTPFERQELRILLRDKERRSWLHHQFFIWLKYLAAVPSVATGIYFIFSWLLPLLQAMPKKGG